MHSNWKRGYKKALHLSNMSRVSGKRIVGVKERCDRKEFRDEMDPYEFILDKVDTVPHLEALMLLWNSRPVGWTCAELASRLYIPLDKVSDLLRDLVRMQFISESFTDPPRYSYVSRASEQDELMRMVDTAYRQDLVRISTMIHAKASPAIREFARAFRFKKSDDQ